MKTFRLVIDDFSIFSRAYNVPSVIYYRVNVCQPLPWCNVDVKQQTQNTTDKLFRRKKHFGFVKDISWRKEFPEKLEIKANINEVLLAASTTSYTCLSLSHIYVQHEFYDAC